MLIARLKGYLDGLPPKIRRRKMCIRDSGSLHQQDAQVEGREKAAYRGRGLEGSLVGKYG